MNKIILIFIINSTLSFGFITVGNDVNCNFNTNVIGSNMFANDEIRITNQQVYEPIEIINHGANIIGGYDNCTDAQNNIVSQTASILFGDNSQTPLVIKTTASGGHNHRVVTIANIEIVDGNNVTSEPNVTIGGGIEIVGNVNVTLTNVEVRDSTSTFGGAGIYINGLNGAVVNLNQMNIHDNNSNNNKNGGGILISDGAVVNLTDSLVDSNSARNGAGIKISDSNTLLKISDTIISNNIATNSGGGIDCGGSNTINVSGNSSINHNRAMSFGGGLSLSFFCQATFLSGDNQDLINVQYGIHHNTATTFGGGAHISFNGRLDLIGNNEHFANLTNNEVTSGTSRGGGVYVTKPGSYFRGINARISGNTAHSASAIFTREMAVAHVRRSSGECFGNQICSDISDNISDFSGTIQSESCGMVDINQTAIHDNQASNNVVALLEGNGVDECQSIFEGNVIYNNHKDDNTPTSMIGLDRKHELEFAFNTVVDNNASTIFTMFNASNSNQTLRINASLIWNAPAFPIVATSNLHTYSGNCFGVPDKDTLPPGFGNYIKENIPVFTDAANHDYSRTIFSPYSDDCDTQEYTPRFHDIVGTVRGHEWIPVVLGPYDVGAFEYDDVHFNNVIFQDGLE